jgi:nucleoside-diphosphate-sugar epimerase
VLAALANPGAINKTLVISGPNPLSYSDFIQAIARDKGSKAVCFNLPMPVLKVLALATRLVPFLPSITSDEILRLLEDKNFSVDDMKSVLNIDPMPLSEGLKIFYPLEEAGEHFARF